ncbi:MAG TPA: hypothetical protein VMC81_10430 [Rhodocyclaceae bacterium]|nr:hypothetical protein [Rhodocyclaceae bacterium]
MRVRPRPARTAAAVSHRQTIWDYVLYLSAVVLPGGFLLILAYRLWLRLHT